jgi:hypothetical protein
VGYDAGNCRVNGTVQDIWTAILKRGNLWVMMLVIVGLLAQSRINGLKVGRLKACGL